MRKWKFVYTIDYEVEGEVEEDAINAVVDLIKRDWPLYLGQGDLTEVKEAEPEAIKGG